MKIAIIGYGKMGKIIEKKVLAKGYEIVAKIDPCLGNTILDPAIEKADVCIEFTKPDSVLNNIESLTSRGKNIVVGTTGWDHDLKKVKHLVEKYHTGLFYASNFSIGINLFVKVLQEAAKIVLPSKEYDVAGIEAHHNGKLDSPSGTAKTIQKALLDASGGVEKIPFTSVRCGSIPGTHTILFDSAVDTISLTHTARSREGFADGAIRAAEWLQEKKGVFTMDDMLFEEETQCYI